MPSINLRCHVSITSIISASLFLTSPSFCVVIYW